VSLGRRKKAIAALEVQHERHEVAHGSGRNPERRLQPQQLGDADLDDALARAATVADRILTASDPMITSDGGTLR
jgi:hypothetical protein